MRISYIEVGVKFRFDKEVVFLLKDNLFSFIIHKINKQSVIVETSAYGIYKSLITELENIPVRRLPNMTKRPREVIQHEFYKSKSRKIKKSEQK